MCFIFFFFNDTATTEIYTLSLHDALPIYKRFGGNFHFFVSGGAYLPPKLHKRWENMGFRVMQGYGATECAPVVSRSEEHTSELQSQSNLVCRLLLEKKNKC